MVGLLLLMMIFKMGISRDGVDVSTSVADFGCLKRTGVEFVIVRGYRSIGAVDLNGIETFRKGKESGMEMGLYMFPCGGKSA